MAVRFTAAEVEAIASLARIQLEPAEIEVFARQLGDILAYANEVQAVDTTDIPPTAHVMAQHESERPDQVSPSLDRDVALESAPDASAPAGLFKVPRVLG